MRKSFLIILLTVLSLTLLAQYKVQFIIQENLPPQHDSIYITGYFNNWNPGDKQYLLKSIDASHKSVTLSLPSGKFEFKFTRGDWSRVEKDNLCKEMQNRRIEIHRDTVIKTNIAAWMDECNTENLVRVLKTQGDDTNKVNTLLILSSYQTDIKKSIQYSNDAISLSKKIDFKKGEGASYVAIARNYRGNEARKFYLKAIEIQQQLEDKSQVAETYLKIAYSYNAEENYPEALQNAYTAINFYEQADDKLGMANTYSLVGYYEGLDNDSDAIKNYQIALKLYEEVGAGDGEWGVADANSQLAQIYSDRGDYEQALQKDSVALKIFKREGLKSSIANILFSIGYIRQQQSNLALTAGDKVTSKQRLDGALTIYLEALKLNEEEGNAYEIAYSYLYLGSVNIQLKNPSISRTYFEKSLSFFKTENNKAGLESSYFFLSRLDSTEGNYTQAYNNYKLYILYRDSLINEENRKKMVQAKMQYQFDKKEALAKTEQEKKDAEAKRIKDQQYLIIASLGIVVLAVLIVAFIQYRNNKHKQKANTLLQQQKEKVESTLTELKSTQAQLIQSEKMASLGELTAGIAHEIQNPLNFVNNFSEVNKELVEELQSELKAGNTEDAIAISNDIKENEEKILHHGKRADAIVKSMMQHSRVSSGQKELTDINALVDEYLRLSYHGMRAKDKNFNAEIKTDFDASIQKMNVVPQDIGRVLLNLFNNTFYAVHEKKQTLNGSFEPVVLVSTKKGNGNVMIRVEDNGLGIPQKVLDKIFQPFFTTKPTGQGTGLGLSLSYDIIKAHGGEIKVETKEGEGSEFVVMLPV